VLEVAPTFLMRIEVTDGADGFPEFLNGACAGASEMGLELGEGHLDGVEVGAVGGQKKEPGSFFFEDGFGLFAFVAGQVVEDDDVARSQGGGKLSLDIGFEENLVHGALDGPGGGEAIAPQGGDESLGAPMAEWRFGLEPLAALGSPAQPGHLGGGGGGGGFVEEHQPIRFLAHPGLAVASPRPTVISDISTTGFGRQHCFFDGEAAGDQEARQRGGVSRDPALGFQLGRQFRHGDVALSLHPTDQKRGVRSRFAASWRTSLPRWFQRSRRRHPLGKADARARAHVDAPA